MVGFFKKNKKFDKQFILNKKLILSELRNCNASVIALDPKNLKNFNIDGVLSYIDIVIYKSFEKIINYYKNIITSPVSDKDFQEYNKFLSSKLDIFYHNIYKLIDQIITPNVSSVSVNKVDAFLKYFEGVKKIIASNIRDIDEFQKKINEIAINVTSVVYLKTTDPSVDFVEKIDNFKIADKKIIFNENVHQNTNYRQYSNNISYNNIGNGYSEYQKSEQKIHNDNGNGVFAASYESGVNGIKKHNIKISGLIKNNKIVDETIETNTLNNKIDINTGKNNAVNKLKK